MIALVCGAISYAQKIKTVSATYTYHAPESMSIDEAKRTAIERAKIQAIADEFGTLVAQSNTTVINNLNGQTDSNFYSVGGSEVKGEWIETIGEPEIDISFEDRCVVVRCKITGKAKEKSWNKTDFEAHVLCKIPDRNFATTNFSDGDDMYLYFKSPVSGCLSVFLLCRDENAAYRLLPYKSSDDSYYHIKGDMEYLFFSQNQAADSPEDVDEYTLSTDSETEYNDLVVIFSPSEFKKTGLKNKDDITIPKHTSISKFNNWLSKLRIHNDDLTTSTITLKISKQ